jgi:phosphatidylserine decarboxylase
MDTVWAGTVNPPRARRVERTDWSRRDIDLDKGDEMGRFNMGSTVIVLLPPAAVAALEEFATGDPVLMGQRLGRLR